MKEKISFNRIFIILVTLSICLYSIISINYLNDWYWHTKIGEYIIQNGIPKIGVFSWFAEQNNISWTAHEWLSEVLFYVIGNNLEIPSLVFGKIMSTLLVLLLTFLATKDCKNHMIQSLFLALLTSMNACLYTYARPHIFSYFLLFATIYLSNRTITKKDNSCFLLLPLAILWGNLHGGSSNLVYVIPIVYGISSLFSFSLFKIKFGCEDKKSALKTLLSGLATIPCLLLNPYGFEMILYPYSNMNDDTMLKYIEEWVTPSINDLYGFMMFLCLFIAIFVFCNTKKEKLEAKDVIMVAFGTFLFFKAARFFPYYSIILCYILPKYMPKEREIKPPFKIKVAMATIAIVFSICMPLFGIMDINKDFVEEDTQITQEMITKIKEYNPTKLYNHFNYGGYLIYNDIPCFIDGRADMYTQSGVFQDFIAISRGVYGYESNTTIEQYIEKYQFDAFLCLKSETLNYYLKENQNDYVVYYEDEYSVFWVKGE